MRSALFSGVPAKKYTPQHVERNRTPALLGTAVTTAGLTLALLPIALSGSPASAAESSATAVQGSAPALTSRSGAVVVNGRLTGPTGGSLAGKQLEVQRYMGREQWKTYAAGVTDGEGVARIGTTLPRSSGIRVFFRGDKGLRPVASGYRTVRRPVASTLGQRAVTEASRFYGRAYRYGATGPANFDCSGFTGYVYRSLGKSLPRVASDQQRATRPVPVSQKQVGDLIFTYTGGQVSHVGIYAGNNVMWAATKSGDIVRKQTIWSRSISVGRVA